MIICMIMYIYMTIYMLYISLYIYTYKYHPIMVVKSHSIWWPKSLQKNLCHFYPHFSEVPEAFATRRFGRPSPNGDRWIQLPRRPWLDDTGKKRWLLSFVSGVIPVFNGQLWKWQWCMPGLYRFIQTCEYMGRITISLYTPVGAIIW